MSSTVLTIDVAEELRALSSDQLRATWQVPAELVRLAVRLGARGVEVARRRRGFALRCEGAAVDGERIADLGTALDPDRAPDARHRALLRLEAGGVQALLWAAGMGVSSLRIETCGSGQWTRLDAGSGGPVGIETAPAGTGEEWFRVRVAAPSLDSRQAMTWLQTATRFCPVPVVVDGTGSQRSFASALLESECREPLPARLAVTLTGDAPRLWLLRHGVLATQATVAGWPPFAAAVEMAGLVRPQASPDELLEAVSPHVGGLAERAVDMVLAAVDELPGLAEATRQRLVCVLLRAARVGLRRERILQAPLLRAVEGQQGDVHWRSPLEVQEPAGECSGPLSVVPADAAAARHRGGGAASLVLSTEERFLLGELLGVRLERPSGTEETSLPWWSPRRGAPLWLRSRRWRPGRRRIVPSDELLQAELGLLAVLNGQLAPPLEARLCAGDGPPLRRRNRLLLPRQNPLVVRALRLASADRTWVYPAALALLGEEARPGRDLRRRWQLRCLSGDGTAPAAGTAEAG